MQFSTITLQTLAIAAMLLQLVSAASIPRPTARPGTEAHQQASTATFSVLRHDWPPRSSCRRAAPPPEREPHLSAISALQKRHHSPPINTRKAARAPPPVVAVDLTFIEEDNAPPAYPPPTPLLRATNPSLSLSSLPLLTFALRPPSFVSPSFRARSTRSSTSTCRLWEGHRGERRWRVAAPLAPLPPAADPAALLRPLVCRCEEDEAEDTPQPLPTIPTPSFHPSLPSHLLAFPLPSVVRTSVGPLSIRPFSFPRSMAAGAGRSVDPPQRVRTHGTSYLPM
ncbi:hypothetical protein C8J57DRAFT_1712057 [Mycena rebaudengoi]|nr:hypothetical protein C8J57DRAFT_1712057 [Mycena rebaudengoi]